MAYNHELSSTSLVKLMSFLFWSGLYLQSVTKWPERSPEWHSRVVTFLHGSVATLAGLAQCSGVQLTPVQFTMKITLGNYLLMVWSWGYFAYDLLWCLIYWTDSYLMLIHHTSALVAITVYMQKDFTGCTFACTLAMLEITNPLLQTRWFLRDEGYKNTIFYQLIEVTYLVSFLFIRGVLGTYLVFKIMNSDIFDIEEKLISLVFYMVSVGLIYDIVGYVVYRYKQKLNSVAQKGKRSRCPSVCNTSIFQERKMEVKFSDILYDVGARLNQQV